MWGTRPLKLAGGTGLRDAERWRNWVPQDRQC